MIWDVLGGSYAHINQKRLSYMVNRTKENEDKSEMIYQKDQINAQVPVF